MVEEKKEEKLEFLKRKEVRTMAKDIARIREVEAQRERERIAELRFKEEKGGEIEEEKAPATLIPKSLGLGKQPLLIKVLVRAILVVFVLLLLSFFYWLWIEREKEPPPEEALPPTKEEKIIEEPPIKEPPIEELPIEELPVPLHIIERIVNWGYFTPEIPRTIDTIVLHSTYNTLEGDVHNVDGILQQYKSYRVAVHYLITRDDTVYRLVPDKAVAFHSGRSIMPDGSRKNIINNFSLGISLIYTKTESPTETQYQILARLVKQLRQEYNIPLANVLKHKTIAPDRKTIPWNFNWDHFSALIAD